MQFDFGKLWSFPQTEVTEDENNYWGEHFSLFLFPLLPPFFASLQACKIRINGAINQASVNCAGSDNWTASAPFTPIPSPLSAIPSSVASSPSWSALNPFSLDPQIVPESIIPLLHLIKPFCSFVIAPDSVPPHSSVLMKYLDYYLYAGLLLHNIYMSGLSSKIVRFSNPL